MIPPRLAAAVSSLLWGLDPSTTQELVGALAVYRRWSAANDRPVSEGLEVLAAHLESAEARSAATSAQQWSAESWSSRDDTPAEENGFALLDTEEAARMLGVSPSTVRRLTSADELTSVRVGRSLRFHPDDIDVFIEANRS